MPWDVSYKSELSNFSTRTVESCKVTFLIFWFLLGVLFLSLTAIYGHQPCSNQAIVFLGIQGMLLVLRPILAILCALPCVRYVLDCLDFLVWILGSIVIFRAYSSVVPLACPLVPFYVAFGYLVSMWTITGLYLGFIVGLVLVQLILGLVDHFSPTPNPIFVKTV